MFKNIECSHFGLSNVHTFEPNISLIRLILIMQNSDSHHLTTQLRSLSFTAGLLSYRYPRTGSIFIQAFSDILSEYASSSDVLSMTTKVSYSLTYHLNRVLPSGKSCHQ